jgi:3-hydroxyisobutyrate dehydrogenase-like beta-hydroxyacid dehydrogenase
MTSDAVALLGAGKMGAAFVDRWAAAGRPVVVWNRTAAAAADLERDGVRAAGSVAEAVEGAPVVVTMLTSGDALRSVLIDQGGLAAMAAGSTLVDLSTVDVRSSAAVAEVAARHGVNYVRGAVSGTPPVVRAGAASLVLSGPADALAAAARVLGELADAHAVVGEAEEARVVKIAVNSMLAGTMQLLAEATVLAEASGVERSVFLDALDASVLSSRFVSYKGAAMRARDYTPTFTTADMAKDIALANVLGDDHGVVLPLGSVVREQLSSACAAGYGPDDFMALLCVQQAASGRAADLAPKPAD